MKKMKRIPKCIRFMLCMTVILFALTTAVMGCYQKEPEIIEIQPESAESSSTAEPQPSAAPAGEVINTGMGRVLRMLQLIKAQIGGDDQGLAAAVAAVYHVVDLFQPVFRAALHAEIVQNQQRIAAQAGNVLVSALKAAGQVIEDGSKVRHADRDFLLHQGVGNTGSKKLLPVPTLPQSR